MKADQRLFHYNIYEKPDIFTYYKIIENLMSLNEQTKILLDVSFDNIIGNKLDGGVRSCN